ncbi:MAG: preprotein translocase subunit SecA [Candidatus Krumholzibacteria bacterium]|nr:preprotein translocase subunit SecA [Candidatus Krumholzibacteria bacterium]
MKGLMQLVFGDRKARLMKRLEGEVAAVKEWAERYRELAEADFPRKTDEFVSRIREGESLDSILPEAYGLAYEACRRLVGRTWDVVGHPLTWDMVPFDVQIAGAIVLHRGMITEMATGEGKTLVATMPLYLNSLAKKGAHLVTVNDYLARRDAEWMGEIYRFLGVSVGYLQNEMGPDDRQPVYACDITYGTNNEFGFDYLRDNMRLEKQHRVQRGFFFAIVDEVDSVLIDEARTPLIISGPVSGSGLADNYSYLRNRVELLVRKQKQMINDLMTKVEKADEDGAEDHDIGVNLLLAQRGDPKNKKFTKLRKKSGHDKLMLSAEADFMREKRLHELDEELYFVIDEKANTIDLTEKGRTNLSPEDQELFVLPDLSIQIKEIESDASLEPKEVARKKDAAYRKYAEKTEVIHNFSQLLKAYALFEKDVDYVVQDGHVLIVDEFTGRLMPGRRFSEGLHQALEAKERVTIEGETQTLATITLQNYFRMYGKLAGMTGTAETEEEEFHKIYKLVVEVIPTNKPVRRVDYDDIIFRTKREKYSAIIQEIRRVHERGLPILVGTVSVEVSETLSRMLTREGIQHNVLNAKYHQREAEIVSTAGKKGAVTIATNMAGRGTDIKLGPGVVQCERCCIYCETPNECDSCSNPHKSPAECLEDVPCGLNIIGTERHEARRIDRQLRGRSGRQGDPGSSRFFISLEDDLMRLFGSERISAVMDRIGVKEGEVIQHRFITRAIGNAQKRVELYNFGIRKRLLEYDDVMNKQREVIYGRRNQILDSENLDEIVDQLIDNTVVAALDRYAPENAEPDDWDLDSCSSELENVFLVPFDFAGIFNERSADLKLVYDHFRAKGLEAFNLRKSVIPPEIMQKFMSYIMLQSIDEKWMDHLYELDYLREGIHLRSYAQKDPLIEYKQEAFQMFGAMVEDIDRSILKALFHARFESEQEGRSRRRPDPGVAVHHVTNAYGAAGAARAAQAGQGSGPAGVSPEAASQGQAPKAQPIRTAPRAGRNDPCPCGSGKKYKKCCGKGAG